MRVACWIRKATNKHTHTLFFIWRNGPQWVMASSFTRFLDHTQRRTTVGRTPLDEWSARRRDLYLTTHDTHNRQTSTLSVGFEPTISAGERTHTYALDRAATGTGYTHTHTHTHTHRTHTYTHAHTPHTHTPHTHTHKINK